MKVAYSVTDPANLDNVVLHGNQLSEFMEKFKAKISEVGKVKEPKGIIYHDFKSASSVYSDTPLPAYTSRELIHICPELGVWKRIYLDAILNSNCKGAQRYFKELNLTDIASIIAHEWTHHLEMFINFEDHNDSNMWFEEGTCFYLPRKLLMDKDQFANIHTVEKNLIDEYSHAFGEYSLKQFGESDKGGFSGALFDYWRASFAITFITEHYLSGEPMELLKLYEEWKKSSNDYIDDFIIQTLHLSTEQAKNLWLT